MRKGLRSGLKAVIGFVYAITMLLTFATYSLFGIKAEDTLRVIVTEATPPHTEVTLFTATLQPLDIQITFWISLAGLGVLLILLYYIDQELKELLAPGLLTLIMTAFVGVIVLISAENILAFVDPYQAVYLETAITRFWQCVAGMVALGVFLVLLSFYGNRLNAKIKK